MGPDPPRYRRPAKAPTRRVVSRERLRATSGVPCYRETLECGHVLIRDLFPCRYPPRWRACPECRDATASTKGG